MSSNKKKYTFRRKNRTPKVAEPSIGYSNSVSDFHFHLIAGVNNSYKTRVVKPERENIFDDKLVVAAAINSGLPYKVFDKIQDKSPLTIEEWASFMMVSPKLIQRYKTDNTRFKPAQTEKILAITEVLLKGIEVFGSYEKFHHWLDIANMALGNIEPISLIHTSYGKDIVMSELIRIEHGILS